MAVAETFRLLLFYLVGLHLENFACEFSCVGTYRHTVDTAPCTKAS